MPLDPTRLPDADRRTVLKVLGAGAVFGGATRSVAAQEQNFQISVPDSIEVEPGESVTLDMSLTQLASPSNPDRVLHARVGFQVCPSEADVVGSDEIDCTPPSWTEYEIVDHSEEQGEWDGSSTAGEWWWTAPDDITEGETRSFSVTIEVADDAEPGSHEIFAICWSYPAGPRILPQPQLDEQALVEVSVFGPSIPSCVEDQAGPYILNVSPESVSPMAAFMEVRIEPGGGNYEEIGPIVIRSLDSDVHIEECRPIAGQKRLVEEYAVDAILIGASIKTGIPIDDTVNVADILRGETGEEPSKSELNDMRVEIDLSDWGARVPSGDQPVVYLIWLKSSRSIENWGTDPTGETPIWNITYTYKRAPHPSETDYNSSEITAGVCIDVPTEDH